MELKKKPQPSRTVAGWRWGDADGLVPHPCAVDKNWEGYFGSEGSQPHARPPAQGSSARKISPHNFWLWKPVGQSQWKKLLDSQAVLYKRPTHGLTQTHSLWAPALGWQLERHKWHMGRRWSGWHQGESRGIAFFQIELLAEAIAPLLSPPCTEPQSCRHHIWDSINLAHTGCPPC